MGNRGHNSITHWEDFDVPGQKERERCACDVCPFCVEVYGEEVLCEVGGRYVSRDVPLTSSCRFRVAAEKKAA